MNTKKLFLALLAGIALAPSLQASDSEPEEPQGPSWKKWASEMPGAAGREMYAQGASVAEHAQQEALAWRAYLGQLDQATVDKWVEDAQSAYDEAEKDHNEKQEALDAARGKFPFWQTHSQGSPATQGAKTSPQQEAWEQADTAFNEAKRVESAAYFELLRMQNLQRMLRNMPTLRGQLDGMYGKKVSMRGVVEGTQGYVQGAYEGAKNLPGRMRDVLKQEVGKTNRYVRSFLPQGYGGLSEQEPRYGSPGQGTHNLLQTPLPVAGAFLSSVILDRIFALLGKKFPTLFGTADELRDNKILAAELLATGIYGSRMEPDYADQPQFTPPASAACEAQPSNEPPSNDPQRSIAPATRHEKALLAAVLMGVGTLAGNGLSRWLSKKEEGKKQPTAMQEVKHALKIAVLNYWNALMAARLRDISGGE